ADRFGAPRNKVLRTRDRLPEAAHKAPGQGPGARVVEVGPVLSRMGGAVRGHGRASSAVSRLPYTFSLRGSRGTPPLPGRSAPRALPRGERLDQGLRPPPWRAMEGERGNRQLRLGGATARP